MSISYHTLHLVEHCRAERQSIPSMSVPQDAGESLLAGAAVLATIASSVMRDNRAVRDARPRFTHPPVCGRPLAYDMHGNSPTCLPTICIRRVIASVPHYLQRQRFGHLLQELSGLFGMHQPGLHPHLGRPTSHPTLHPFPAHPPE